MKLTRKFFLVSSYMYFSLTHFCAAQLPRNTPELIGEIQGADANTLRVKDSDGIVRSITLAPDTRVIAGTSIARMDLAQGDVVATSALAVPTPDGTGLVSHGFMRASGGTARDRGNLARLFLEDSSKEAPVGQFSRVLVSGRFDRLIDGALMVTDRNNTDTTVKIGPEAAGYDLDPTDRRHLQPGEKVIIPLLPSGNDRTMVIDP